MAAGQKHATLTSLAGDAGPVRRWLVAYFRRRLNEKADAEDLAQEVFARLAAREGSEPVEHLGGYVLKTASSVLADRARRQASHFSSAHVEFDTDLHGGEEIDPERIVGAREELSVATAALLALPERTRTVFVLQRLEGCRHREIAERLGISVSAVEKHLVRAIHHLSLHMENHRGS